MFHWPRSRGVLNMIPEVTVRVVSTSVFKRFKIINAPLKLLRPRRDQRGILRTLARRNKKIIRLFSYFRLRREDPLIDVSYRKPRGWTQTFRNRNTNVDTKMLTKTIGTRSSGRWSPLVVRRTLRSHLPGGRGVRKRDQWLWRVLKKIVKHHPNGLLKRQNNVTK